MCLLHLSSRTCFGICQTTPVECSAGQMLKRVQHDRKRVTCIAFTMAEILLSLTIIGVVAAITLPSLTGNINERTWNTQRKALYARFSQAIALMPALNGYGTLKEESSAGASDAEDTAAETFVVAGLSKVLKINNICASEHLYDCGITSKGFNTVNGNKVASFPATFADLNGEMLSYSMFKNTKVAAFETANGESLVVYYNPKCTSNMNERTSYKVQSKVCVNFLYDLNGSKGPNTVGKDIGVMTALYSSDSVVVAPVINNKEALHHVYFQEGVSACRKMDEEYRLPNFEELVSLFVNHKLYDIKTGQHLWSSTAVEGGKVKGLFTNAGTAVLVQGFGGSTPADRLDAYCVKR